MEDKLSKLIGKKVTILGEFPVIITGILAFDGYGYNVTVSAGETFCNFDITQVAGLSDYLPCGYPTIIIGRITDPIEWSPKFW